LAVFYLYSLIFNLLFC